MVEVEGRGESCSSRLAGGGSAALPGSGEPPSQGSHSTQGGWTSLCAVLGVGPHLCALDWDWDWDCPLISSLGDPRGRCPMSVTRLPAGIAAPRRAATQAREARRAPSPTYTCPGSGLNAEPARASAE